MKRIVYDVSMWDAIKHREARGIASVERDDTRERAFEDELFGRLYTGTDGLEKLPVEKIDPTMGRWAARFHEAVEKSPDFQRLADQCRGDVALSGIAVENLVCAVRPLLDAADEAEANAKSDLDRAAAQRQYTKAIATAARTAAGAVESVEETMEAFKGLVTGFSDEDGQHSGEYAANVRELAHNMGKSARLRELAKKVGRFRRMAVAKHAQKVRHGSEEVHGITIGDDVARLLPTEIGRLANPARKLAFYRDLYEKSLFQYELVGRDTKGSGPMVYCVDKSTSMRGENDTYATALGLAMAEICRRERRVFAIVSFDHRILQTVVVKPGESVPAGSLMVRPNGGTDISMAVEAALKIIAENGALGKADIVVATDGESDTEAHASPDDVKVVVPAAADLKAAAKQAGVTVWGLGIGHGASLNAWCDSTVNVFDLDTLDPTVASNLFLKAQE